MQIFMFESEMFLLIIVFILGKDISKQVLLLLGLLLLLCSLPSLATFLNVIESFEFKTNWFPFFILSIIDYVYAFITSVICFIVAGSSAKSSIIDFFPMVFTK